MATAFPITLQSSFNISDFTTKKEDNVIRSEVAIGRPKRRRRYTSEREIFAGSIILKSATEYNTFMAFYNTSLVDGSLPFEHDHPITGTTTEFEFTEPPTVVPLGNNNYRLSMMFREIPS